MAKAKKMTPIERRRIARAAAMPEVKRLVKRYGRATIANCVAKIRDHEKAAQKLLALKREVAQLEKRI